MTHPAGLGNRGQDLGVGDGVRVGRRGEQRPPLDRQADQTRGPGRLIAGPDEHRGRPARRRCCCGTATAAAAAGLFVTGSLAHAIWFMCASGRGVEYIATDRRRAVGLQAGRGGGLDWGGGRRKQRELIVCRRKTAGSRIR